MAAEGPWLYGPCGNRRRKLCEQMFRIHVLAHPRVTPLLRLGQTCRVKESRAEPPSFPAQLRPSNMKSTRLVKPAAPGRSNLKPLPLRLFTQ
jgi:hypothetical protein